MPGIGLVLGAGGEVGYAFHAGVLTALAEVTGWDAGSAEVIVGTSAGSIAGAVLRAGCSPIDLAARGVGFLLHEGGLPVRLRSFHLSDQDLETLASRAQALRATSASLG